MHATPTAVVLRVCGQVWRVPIQLPAAGAGADVAGPDAAAAAAADFDDEHTRPRNAELALNFLDEHDEGIPEWSCAEHPVVAVDDLAAGRRRVPLPPKDNLAVNDFMHLPTLLQFAHICRIYRGRTGQCLLYTYWAATADRCARRMKGTTPTWRDAILNAVTKIEDVQTAQHDKGDPVTAWWDLVKWREFDMHVAADYRRELDEFGHGSFLVIPRVLAMWQGL